MEKIETPAADACPDCAGRREFLRDFGLAAAALFVGLGASRSEAAALPVSTVLAPVAGAAELRYPVPPADGATIDRANEIILARYHGSVYAFALSCPHQRTVLRWQPDQARFECPKHHSRYQPDGAYVSGRATRSMDRHPVRLESGSVVVDAATVLHQDENAADWTRALVAVG